MPLASGPLVLGAAWQSTVNWTGAITAVQLRAPTSGKKFTVKKIIVSANAACKVTIFDGSNSVDNRVALLDLAANAGAVLEFENAPYISKAVDNNLQVTTSAAGGDITVYGNEA